MNYKLTRRQFGQLAIGSTAVACLGYLANKTLAASTEILYALDVGSDTLKVGIIGISTGSVTISLTLPRDSILSGGDQITGFTAASQLIAVINPSKNAKKSNYSPSLLFLSSSPTIVTLSGLNKNETLHGIVGKPDGSLYGLVTEDRSHKKVQLVSIDTSTGKTKKIAKISDSERFNNLSLFSNGTLLSTSIDTNGYSNLVQLNPSTGQTTNKGKITSRTIDLNNGLTSLAYSSSNSIYALGAQRYAYQNSLFQVSEDGTATQLLENLDYDLIAVSSMSIL